MAQIKEMYIEKSTKTVFILNKNLLNIFKKISSKIIQFILKRKVYISKTS